MPGAQARRVARLMELARARKQCPDFTRDRNAPVAYAHDVLHLHTLTADQVAILESLTRPPYKTLVKSGTEVGKTLVAVAVNWAFDAFSPSETITTSRTYAQVKDVLWKEMRRLRHEA